jgi:hypothetical protein
MEIPNPLHGQGSAGYIFHVQYPGSIVVTICGIPKLYLQGSAGYYYTKSGSSCHHMWDNPALFAGVCGILLYSIRALVVAIYSVG